MLRTLKFTFLCILSFSVFYASSAAQEVVFEDRFEGNLKPGWCWVRENSVGRRFVNNALEILTEPFGANEARNALARPLNFFRWHNGRVDAVYRIETECSFTEKPSAQYQQCGVYWIQNDRVLFKLVFENVDGKMYVFPGKTPIDSNGGRLRLTVRGQNIVAEYCGENESSFRKVYEGRLEMEPNDKISLQCWNGPQENTMGQWARFRYFRVEKLDE